MNRSELGRQGEDAAADYLLSLGYSLITRRWKRAGGELDLVALDGDTLVFVEVKRTEGTGYEPELALSDQKMSRLERIAERYVSEHDLTERPQRFDLVAIDANGLRHYQDVLRH